MNVEKICSLFTLFSGETDVTKYMSFINSAMYDVLPRLKKDADLCDERLSFLCAAIANLRYMQIMGLRDRLTYTYAGSVAQNDNSEKKSKLAENLVREYWLSISDLTDDSSFIFIKV